MTSDTHPPGSHPPDAPGIFDAHLHIIDPRFPLVANQGYLPPTFTVDDYRQRTSELHVIGGAVVSGSFQAFDQSYLLAALEALGPGFVGVTQLPADVAPSTIRELDRHGVRAVRVNLYRGGSAALDDLETLARLVHDTAGWHTELYVDARDLPDLAEVIRRLPQVTIDHLGMHDDPSGTLLRLVEHGAVVKATGFGRIEIAEPDALMAAIMAVNPAGLMFGTDLPSTRAARPFSPDDRDRAARAVGSAHRHSLFTENARRLYRC